MDKRLIQLNMILTCELLVDLIDELRDTVEFRQSLKSKANNLEAEIEPILAKNMPILYRIDEEQTVNTMTMLKRLISNISRLETNEVILVSQIIDDFKNNKELFNEKYEIVLRKLDT